MRMDIRHKIEKTDVLITGAGPTGLTLANELIRYGIDCRVIDKAEHTSKTSKAIGVMPRTLELLERLQLSESFIEKGLPVYHFTVFSDEKRLVRLDFKKHLKGCFPYLLTIPQYETEEMLFQNLLRLGGKVEWHQKLIDVKEKAEYAAAVVEDSNGVKRQIWSKYIIGCDGPYSTVREWLLPEFNGEQLKKDFAQADLKVEWEKPSDQIFAFVKNGNLSAFFPMKNKQHRVVITTNKEKHDAPPVELDELRQAFAEAGVPTAELSGTTWTSRFRINQQNVEKGRYGRVFLAGDAAHTYTPVGAQGMNTGMQDAFNLGWKLAFVLKYHCSSDLLDTYTPEREPIWRFTQFFTGLATKMILCESKTVHAFRKQILPVISPIAVVQKSLLHTLSEKGIHYRSSDLTDSSVLRSQTTIFHKWLRTRFLFAGDRVPNLRLDQRTQLYDFQKKLSLTILLFSQNTVFRRELFDKLKSQSIPFDLYFFPKEEFKSRRTTHYKTKFGIRNEGLVIVRPDAYISFISDSLDSAQVMRHFSGFQKKN